MIDNNIISYSNQSFFDAINFSKNRRHNECIFKNVSSPIHKPPKEKILKWTPTFIKDCLKLEKTFADEMSVVEYENFEYEKAENFYTTMCKIENANDFGVCQMFYSKKFQNSVSMFCDNGFKGIWMDGKITLIVVKNVPKLFHELKSIYGECTNPVEHVLPSLKFLREKNIVFSKVKLNANEMYVCSQAYVFYIVNKGEPVNCIQFIFSRVSHYPICTCFNEACKICFDICTCFKTLCPYCDETADLKEHLKEHSRLPVIESAIESLNSEPSKKDVSKKRKLNDDPSKKKKKKKTVGENLIALMTTSDSKKIAEN